MKSNYYIALTTCPNPDVAAQLAHSIVAQQLAACVNIIPGIQSVYQWQGKLMQDNESLLIMKTQLQQLAALDVFIHENHPYEVPEFISVAVDSGAQTYLDWITSSLNKNIAPPE